MPKSITDPNIKQNNIAKKSETAEKKILSYPDESRFEPQMSFLCHPACVYRKLIRSKGMKCINDDSEADMLTEKYIVCPISRDYYYHMDTFHVVIRTERGFIGLDIISGEPLMVGPALSAYINWLRNRRRSISIWRSPQNTEDLQEKRTVTDIIYAEFILGYKASKAIKQLAKETYPLFEKTLPDDLRNLSETAISKRNDYFKANSDDEKFFLSDEMIRAENLLIENTYTAYYADNRISRYEFLRIRNRFRGWE